MTNVTSIAVPESELSEFRARGFNVSEFCRAAIRKKLAEERLKFEKPGAESPNTSPRNSPMNTPVKEYSND